MTCLLDEWLSIFYDPTTLRLLEPSTTLKITKIASNGHMTLNVGTQWVPNPAYTNYASSWQMGDPLTLASREGEYYLINGTWQSKTI
ncbi:MAG: hypothetical protein LLG04_06395 [Parachlamydia sp.]|nr:hypothetical protein [Parachlamydia sp.]